MRFDARLYNPRTGNPILSGQNFTLTPERWSAQVWSGAEEASVKVEASDDSLRAVFAALAVDIAIYNEHGSIVWVGYVYEVSLSLSGIEYRATTENMGNRVRVIYTNESPTGEVETRRTDWAAHDLSQQRYGVLEKQISGRRMSDERAEALRDESLDLYSLPEIDARAASGANGATLHCRGYADILNFQYYDYRAGRIENTGDAVPDLLGAAFFSPEVSFTAAGDMVEANGLVAAFVPGTRVDVSGSTYNDAYYVITQGARHNGEPANYTANTIGFTQPETISDTASGLTFVGSGEVFKVSGATQAGNNGTMRANGTQANLIDVDLGYSGTDRIQNEAPGATITIRRGDYISIGGPLVSERDDQNGTVQIACRTLHYDQTFSHSDDVPFRLMGAAIQLQSMGSPTFPVTVGIYEDNAGELGALLEEGTIQHTEVTNDLDWVPVIFDGTTILDADTTYHMRISISDPNRSTTNYYRIGLLETDWPGGHTLRGLGLGGWHAMPGYSLAAIIRSGVDIMEQIRRMGINLPTVDSVIDPGDTGILTDPYRDGTQTSSYELRAMLREAQSAGFPLMIDFTQLGLMHVRQADPDRVRYVWGANGSLRHFSGGKVEPGKLIHGSVVAIDMVPHFDDAALEFSPRFCIGCEYDAGSGSWSPRFSPYNDFDLGYKQG